MKTTDIIPVIMEDVERITRDNQIRRRVSIAKKHKISRTRVKNTLATLGVLATLLLAAACASTGFWWTVVAPVLLAIEVVRKAGWL